MFGRLNALTLKLTTSLFIKVFVSIFVTTQMKLDIKFDCSFKMIILPDNFTHSKHRLSNLTKKISKHSDLLHAYNQIIKSQLFARTIEPVLETDSISAGQVHYLPHHPVIKDSKTMKVRMV